MWSVSLGTRVVLHTQDASEATNVATTLTAERHRLLWVREPGVADRLVLTEIDPDNRSNSTFTTRAGSDAAVHPRMRLMPPVADPQRDWEGGWQRLHLTVDNDVWLVTERIKLKYLRPHLRPGMRALEVGCGSAKLSSLLAVEGLQVCGIDRSPAALRIAQRNVSYLGTTATFVRADAFSLPFPDNSFDLVFSTGLLEHFADPTVPMRSMIRVLNPGGLFFSDIVPLKFSLARSVWYLRGLQRTASDERAYRREHVIEWMRRCELQHIDVFSSAVIPPLGLLARLPGGARLSRLGDPIWTSLDRTRVGNVLGFFYLAFGWKPA